MKPYAAGSKMDKMVKAFVALRAISDMAPYCGGLTGDMFLAHSIIDRKWCEAYTAVGLEEYEALKTCDIYLSTVKD